VLTLVLAAWTLAASAVCRAADCAVDPAHTTIYFAVGHRDISYVRGRFGKMTAKVEFDAVAKAGTIVVDVDTASIDTNNATLDGVLRSQQFLETDTYPDARFLGERFVYAGDALSAVEGKLWLHGIQRPVTLIADRFVCKEVALGLARQTVCGGAFHTVIRRSEFGMTRYPGDVGEEVRIEINVEASRK
jgi:polyisoprenoid-binding protein YceI